MTEDTLPGILNEFFAGGWRIAPFIKTSEGYIGVKAWPKRAATNHAELQALIAEQRERSQKPLIYGVVPTKGRYVVDIDTKNNPAALQLWKDKVVEAYGDPKMAMPDLIVKTQSGGFHLYYSDGSDRIIHSPTDAFGKGSGVDIRGATGMVVAPMSIGSMDDWQLGEYTVIRGRPTDPLTVLNLSKILGDSYDKEDDAVKVTLSQINEALRNDTIHETLRHQLIPNSLVIPASNRDNTLYRCARLCRLAGLSQEAALQFMQHIAGRCETSAEEPLEHWQGLASDKVRRVYASETEMKLQTVSGFYEELDNAGAVMLRGITKSYWYFRHGSKLLKIDPRSKFSTENIGNVLQGITIAAEDGPIPVKKIMGNYPPKAVASDAAMYPKPGVVFFKFEGETFVNTYHDPFAAFEPVPQIMDSVKVYVDRYLEFARHITGYNDQDTNHFLDKIAWMIQKPYRRLSTGTIIYSHTRGSGKDIMMGLVREIVGSQYYMPITLESIDDPHTVLTDKLVCVASEVQLQANARGTIAAANFMGRLKDLVTLRRMQVNEKFVQAYSAPMFAHIFLLSNFELSPLLESQDRRWDVFHASEEKMDQERFGPLADLTNDGYWEEQDESARLMRKHAIYSIRMALARRSVVENFDRKEAVMNEVKSVLMESQNPPSVEWLRHNLPPYFTEEVVMMACSFCPLRTHPEYAMKQLREHFGPHLVQIRRPGGLIYRLNGSPRLEKRSDGSSNFPVLNFDVSSTDPSCRKPIFCFNNTIRDTVPSDSSVKASIRLWYEQMALRYHGNVTKLPGQKPDNQDATT